MVGFVWLGLVWLVWLGLVWYGLVCYSLVWFGVVGMVWVIGLVWVVVVGGMVGCCGNESSFYNIHGYAEIGCLVTFGFV